MHPLKNFVAIFTNGGKHSSNANRRRLKLSTNLTKLILSKNLGPYALTACRFSGVFTANVSAQSNIFYSNIGEQRPNSGLFTL